MNALNILSYLLGLAVLGLFGYFLYCKITHKPLLPPKGNVSKLPGDHTHNDIP